MATQIKQCSNTMSEHCLNVISVSVQVMHLHVYKLAGKL